MRIPAIALALAALAVPVRAFARPSYALTGWTADKGLPPGDVFAMAEDRAGYLWLGTGSGLARFDGVRFDAWNASGERLPGSSVPALVATRDGSVWAGFTDAAGVVRIRDGKLQRYYGDQDGLGKCLVTAMLEDRHGTLWVGCQHGLAVFDGKTWRFVGSDQGLSVDSGISSLYEDRLGTLWVAAATGVFRRVEKQNAFDPVDRAAVYAQSLTEDGAGQIWVSDSHRLAHRLNSSDALTLGHDVRLPSAGWRVLHDQHDALWIAALGGGLLRLDLADNRRTVERISYESILNGSPRSLFEDHDHNIWVGMRGGGLLRVSEVSITTDVPLDGVTNDGVRAMAGAPDGSVWIATGHSLNRFSGSSREVFALPQTLALHVDPHGTLWAVTSETLGKFARGRLEPLSVPESVRLERTAAVTTDAAGNLWLCTIEQGMFVSRHGVLTAVSGEEVAGRGCSYTTTDSHGRVWIGFQRGGAAYYDGTFHVFGQKDGLAAGGVLAIQEDAGGDMWIGTNVGVSRWTNGRFATATMSGAFDGRFNSALIDDAEGQMWLGGNSGAALLRFNRRDLDAFWADRRRDVPYSVYDGSDGLQGQTHWVSRPSIVRDGSGRLWFATGNGVVVIDPHRPPPIRRPSAPRVERVVADGRTVDTLTPITLANSSSVSIGYSAISLSSGSKVRFRYMLEGLSNVWTDAGTSRSTTFEHLAPGRYRFRVASTTDGTWTETDSAWEFAVRPPFYLTIPFYVLIAAAALLTAWLYWLLRLYRMRRQFALVLAERARVGREIHDTLLQSLGAVGVELEVVASQLRATDGPVADAADALTRLRREVSRCVREARESIWELRSSRLETRDLAAALEDLADDVGTARAVQVDVEARGRAWAPSPETDEQLLRIAQEAVGNAVRHGRAKRVRVSLDYDRDRVALRVADDGCGFVPSEHRSEGEHWGLTTMRERAQRIGGQLRIMSGRGEGTIVETVVPRRGEA